MKEISHYLDREMPRLKLRQGTVLMFTLIVLVTLLAIIGPVSSQPEGPTVTYIFNQTNDPDAATIINTTGGTITTVVLNATTQNIR